MVHYNNQFGPLKGKTYYADKDDLNGIIKKHVNKHVVLQTKDGYTYNGLVQHIDDENVYLGVPGAQGMPGAYPGVGGGAGYHGGYHGGYPGVGGGAGAPGGIPGGVGYPGGAGFAGPGGVGGYQGYPQPYGQNPYVNAPYQPYRQEDEEVENRENQDERIYGGFGPGFGGGFGGFGHGFGGGLGGFGPGFGGGFGGFGPGFGTGFGGFGPGFGAGFGGGLSSLVFPLASLAALSV